MFFLVFLFKKNKNVVVIKKELNELTCKNDSRKKSDTNTTNIVFMCVLNVKIKKRKTVQSFLNT